MPKAKGSYITNAEGNFFWQTKRRRPHTWLTCTGVGDIDMPKGDRAADMCPDPMRSGRFKIHGFRRGQPAAGTYDLTKPLSKTYNALIDSDCDFVGRVNWVCRGIRQDPTNYEVAFLMLDSGPTRTGITAPVARDGDSEARVDTTLAINFSPGIILYRVAIARIDVENEADAYCVYFMPKQCADRCGNARDLCEHGIIGLDDLGLYAYESEVKKTLDGCASFEECATDPFSYGGAVRTCLILETLGGESYLVFRGEAVVGAPAEVGISYNRGVTWENHFIGNTYGEFVYDVKMLGADIYVCCNTGAIYRSSDQGLTWARLSDGTAAGGNALYKMAFYGEGSGYAVGESNTFVYTLNANTWIAGTGPAADTGADLRSIGISDAGDLLIGTDDGRMFRSEDGGDTFIDPNGVVGEWLNLVGGSIDWIGFSEEDGYVGLMLYNDVANRGWAYRSEDGGATWRRIVGQPNNLGYNGAYICDPNHAVIVGNVYDGSTFIAMMTPGV
jgi:photosystem II stability/assembly factor-like uncharacterized protein